MPDPLNKPLINLDEILSGLSERGYAVLDGALAEPCLAAIVNYLGQLPELDFKPAGVGPGQAQQLSTIRSDQIHWLPPEQPALALYWRAMEALRLSANQAFYLGLFDYECHFAHYAAGSFYQKHWDAFRGRSNRRLSSVLYLNQGWQAEWGGELILYNEQNPDLIEATILPEMGRLVVFFSELFAHEVKPATRERWSLTGWFRVR
ncbi:2OG-Fe(II) oxygenase [Halioxenophilus sp. WMMB6]|uniref:2OG-Fe(II) oxygenase n=1 Tax=Halioxenophilus sp. WMMB6 TaxID=3073815 RepID=UPI00295E3BBB|nr:2OG-Fe(II) oxygenase [Halioxenophilus sp. WMMB6]